MNRVGIIFGIAVISFQQGFSQSQSQDTLTVSPKKAAYYALIPGGGQVYNHRPVKAGVLLGAMGLAVWRWSVNSDAYKNYDDSMALSKHRYLEKRNKYAWWVGFIYFYGLIDAVVDAHLKPFRMVMEEDLEETNKEK